MCFDEVFFYSPNSKINRYCCSAKTTTTYLPTYDVKLLLLLRFLYKPPTTLNYDHRYCVFKMKNLTKKEKLKKTKCLTQCTKNYCVIATITNSILQSLNDDDLRKKEKRKNRNRLMSDNPLFFQFIGPPTPLLFPSLFESQSHYRQLLLFGPSAPRPPKRDPHERPPQTSSTTIILFSKLLISSLSFLATHTLHTNTYVRINAMYAIACAYIHENTNQYIY